MIDFTSAWEIEDGKYGRKLSLHVDWSDDILEMVRSKGIQELLLLKWGDPEWNSLDFLATVPWLKSFTLLGLLTKNIGGIHFLRELRSIYMGDYSKKPIDFSNFPLLRECRMEFCKGRISVTGCKNLELLSLQHYSYKDFSKLTSLTGLTTLDIAQGSLADISDIGAFWNLRDLKLVLLRNLKDISPLSHLGNIEELELEGSKGIENLNALSGLTRLRRLNIANCGEIESLAPLVGCESLQILKFSEDTNIRDGDLKVLMRIPNLKYVTLANRRHYNLRREEIPMFGAKYPSMQS